MADLETLQGILALVDVVNFTPQAEKLGEKYTAQYTAYFQEKIKTIATKYKFRVVKTLGDAVLVFGTSPAGLLEIMLDLFERDKPGDQFGFISRFRLVAHSGFFQFLMENDTPVDLVSAEGIKVFRLEKYAGTWELIVTHPLFQGIKPLLNRFRMEARRMVLNQPLKGFYNQEWFPPFYRLRIMPESGVVSNLLEQRLEELEQEVQFIPVFGRIYPPVPMAKNFINLGLKWQPAWEINVPTLYQNHYQGIIIGLPGAGKTTILKYLAFLEFKGSDTGKEKGKQVVLFIPCRGIPLYDEWHISRFGKETVEPDRESAREYLTWIFLFDARSYYDVTPEELAEFQEAAKIVHQASRENRLTLLVDALDEAPDSTAKENIMRLFRMLATESQFNAGNRFFLTSRPSERPHLEQKEIPVFHVLSLGMEQVRAVARNLMEEDSEIYQKFDQAIWQEEMVVKMAATPLTALLVTAYFQVYEKFHHRFPMYDMLVKFTLFRAWELIKMHKFPFKNLDLFFQEIKKPGFLEREREIRILYDALASLCFDLFYDRPDGKIQWDVDEELLMAYFDRFIGEHLPYEQGENPLVRADQWIQRFHQDHLLLKAGKTQYVFVHAAVMEFLAAYHLVNRIIKKREEVSTLLRKCLRSEVHPELETLPIAAGCDLLRGFAILSTLRDLELPYDTDDREILHEVAGKCLAELEWQIDKTFQAIPLESLMKPMLDLIRQNLPAVDWLYKYLKELVLTPDKGGPRKSNRRFAAPLKLSRDTLLKEYLVYEDFNRGDPELVSLRKDLLFQLVQKDVVEQWLRAHHQADVENTLRLDSPRLHPEDKNFHYFQAMMGKELQGFFGSPNMRHSRAVRACAFPPNGKTFVSASDDGTLKLWEEAGGKEIRSFNGHTDKVLSCAFSPDGTWLVSASEDNTLKLWEIDSGKELRTFTGHRAVVRCCAFSPDGTRLVSASEDKTLKLWEVASGKELRTFAGHRAALRCCAFSPDGSFLVSASFDHTLKLWDAASSKEIRTFTGHQLGVLSCVFSPDGVHLVSASYDHTLKLWEVASGKEIRTFTGHNDGVLNCCFSTAGTHLASASYDQTLKLWEVASGKEIRTFPGHMDYVWCCAFSPDGTHLVSASADKKLKMWEVVSGKEIRDFSGHTDPVWGCAFSPDGLLLVSASEDKTLKLWKMATGKEIHTFTGHNDPVWACAFSPDGSLLVSASEDNTLILWEMASGKEIRTFSGHTDPVWACAFSPDGSLLVSASEDETLKLWDVDSGKNIRTFNGHNDAVLSCAFSPDGRLLVSASEDETLILWDAAGGKIIRSFTGHKDAVSSCAFSPSGSHLVSASEDKTLKLWKVSGGKAIRTFTGHLQEVLNCDFSQSGNHLVSVSEDKTLKLWEVESGKLLKSMQLPWIPQHVTTAKDNRVITANENGTLTLFKFEELE
jgi:WD40 repeat protein